MDAAADKVLKELREIVAAAEDLLAAPGAGAESMKEMRDRAEEALRKASERLEPALTDLENQVRRHPLAALGIAAGVGLVVGLLLSRR